MDPIDPEAAAAAAVSSAFFRPTNRRRTCSVFDDGVDDEGKDTDASCAILSNGPGMME